MAHKESRSEQRESSPPCAAARVGQDAMLADGAWPCGVLPLSVTRASDMCCFYMPARWVMPCLQWAAGEKICVPPSPRPRAASSSRTSARFEMTWHIRMGGLFTP